LNVDGNVLPQWICFAIAESGVVIDVARWAVHPERVWPQLLDTG
jgi:hypothetical protein